MKSLDQLIEEQLRLPPILPQVREQLGRIPGVVGVGVGFRVTAGQVTDDITFRIYVRRKRPLAEVPPEERIPSVIGGVPTDVTIPFGGSEIQIRNVAPSLDRKVSTLVGGVAISYDDSPGQGTLGCFAKPKSNSAVTVLLTNQHVVYQSVTGTGPGELVGQPDISCCWCCKTGVIGRALDGQRGGTVDCAIVRLNDKRPPVQRLPGVGKDANGRNEDLITEVASPVPVAGLPSAVFIGEKVRKLGRSTGPTVGVVHDLHCPLTVDPGEPDQVDYDDQFIIRPEEGGAVLGDGKLNFAIDGDSGAVVINRFNQVVGLLHKAADYTGQPENQPTWRFWGAANHIHHVIDRLQIDIFASPGANVKNTPPNPVPVVPTGALLPGVGLVRRTETEDDRAAAAALDDVVAELRSTRYGRVVLDLYDAFQAEIRRLVNHDRRVKIAWHRVHGPAFVAKLIASLRTPTREIPRQIDGITIEAALRRMTDVLEEHGSPPLAEAVRRYRVSALALLARSATVRDALDLTRDEPALARMPEDAE